MKQLLSICVPVGLAGICTFDMHAQTVRSSVSASEVNGTFRSYFKGKHRGSYKEIKMLALGRGKLKIGLDLMYPYTTRTGELSANTSELTGIAEVSGDTAVYSSE